MLCLSGFQLYSRWVPLIKLQDVGACIFYAMQWFQSSEVPLPPPRALLPPWGSGYIYACMHEYALIGRERWSMKVYMKITSAMIHLSLTIT